MNKALTLNLPILIRPKLSLSSRFLWIPITCLVLPLLVICIFQLNSYTREIYLIQDYEKKLSQLTEENKTLEINFSRFNSLEKVGNYVQNQPFEKADKIEYIRLLESTVLAK